MTRTRKCIKQPYHSHTGKVFYIIDFSSIRIFIVFFFLNRNLQKIGVVAPCRRKKFATAQTVSQQLNHQLPPNPQLRRNGLVGQTGLPAPVLVESVKKPDLENVKKDLVITLITLKNVSESQPRL